ncbi:MAG: ABC transporter permease [Kofleriaceae bacterium]
MRLRVRAELTTKIDRVERCAVVQVHGDLVIPTVGQVHGRLQTLARQRDVRSVVLDFTHTGWIDSAGVATLGLVRRALARAGKRLELRELGDCHRAMLEFVPRTTIEPDLEPPPGVLERVGGRTLDAWAAARALVAMVIDTVRQGVLVVVHRKRMPARALTTQLLQMGSSAVFVVALLSFLLGIGMGLQGVLELQRFGAGVFVADLISMSMVRELGPLITAIILTGRTGAAIAAELGTMRVRSEIDALATMGINPNRFLILPRLAAITIAGPALTLMSMFVGMVGGMMVAQLALDMPVVAFWQRVAERVMLGDYAHGMAKSFVFAWIIAITGSHLGMRANADPSSVGQATTRTVVVSVFFIVLVDAIFATIGTVLERT